MSFKDLGLKKELVEAVEKLGFEHPTPIQRQAIPEIIGGERDLVGLAQTGTGKTAAFGLPMLQLIDFSLKDTQGLVLCPTRELCLQITGDMSRFAENVKHASIVPVYGGASIVDQMRQIKKGAQIIVATPGRLLDLMDRKVVHLDRISYLVLDEADEMLDMGFREDLDTILDSASKNRRTWLFSATMPNEVSRIASNYMNDPVSVTVGDITGGASNIEHVNYMIKEKDRYPALKRVIDYYPDIYGLIFCRTRMETQEIAEKLIKDGYNTEALHGDMSQAMRDKVMGRFRERNLQILVATDVAARGIDVKDLTHVIHYKLPDEIESYTHRSGRTARAGKTGIAIVLMNSRESRKLMEVERSTGIRFTRKRVPGGRSVCEKQLYAMVEKLVSVDVNEEEIGLFLPPVYNTLSGLSREEIIKRFVSLEFNRFLTYYKDSEDINIPDHDDKKSRKGERREVHDAKPGKRAVFAEKTGDFISDAKRFFVGMGLMDNLNKGAIVRLVCDRAGIKSNKIGSIEIRREFSFFEVDGTVADRVRKALKDVTFDGRRIVIDYAAPSKSTQAKPEKKAKEKWKKPEKPEKPKKQKKGKSFRRSV